MNYDVDIGCSITYSVTAITDEWESYHSEDVIIKLPTPEPPVIDGYWDFDGHYIYWNHAETEANNDLSVDYYRVEWKHTHEGNWNVLGQVQNPEGDEIIYTHSNPPSDPNYYRVKSGTEDKYGFYVLGNPSNEILLVSSGGGGGCPYVSIWNGTDYQHDNNILVASEHQEGVVDDNYVLQNTMAPKDGFYSLKIDEFENSEDFFDTFSLYTIDHREGYSIGTTPDGEYRTYKRTPYHRFPRTIVREMMCLSM